jgi:hypothetical protein
MRWAAMVMAVLTPLAVAGSASAGHSVPPNAAALYTDASNSVGHRDPRCFGFNIATKTTLDHGTPSPAMLSTLGVLRRAATAKDRFRTKSFPRLGVSRLFVRYVRRIDTADGARYWILPSADVNHAVAPPRSCDRALAREIRVLGRHDKPSVRLQAMHLAHLMLAAARRDAKRPPVEGIDLYGGHPGKSAVRILSGTSATIQSIKSRGIVMSFGSPGAASTLCVLVPDGVASVTVKYPASKGRPARIISAETEDNMASMTVDSSVQDAFGGSMTWNDANGQPIKTFPAP